MVAEQHSRWRTRHMYETRLGADQLAAMAAVIEFGLWQIN